ncbi:MAG: hypothetical protein R3D29_13190 [Nitratireductor sp.]
MNLLETAEAWCRCDRHRMPNLPHRPRNASGARRKGARPQDQCQILYFTQLLGLAMGLSPKKVGVHENFSDSMTLIKEKGLA